MKETTGERSNEKERERKGGGQRVSKCVGERETEREGDMSQRERETERVRGNERERGGDSV